MILSPIFSLMCFRLSLWFLKERFFGLFCGSCKNVLRSTKCDTCGRGEVTVNQIISYQIVIETKAKTYHFTKIHVRRPCCRPCLNHSNSKSWFQRLGCKTCASPLSNLFAKQKGLPKPLVWFKAIYLRHGSHTVKKSKNPFLV